MSPDAERRQLRAESGCAGIDPGTHHNRAAIVDGQSTPIAPSTCYDYIRRVHAEIFAVYGRIIWWGGGSARPR